MTNGGALARERPSGFLVLAIFIEVPLVLILSLADLRQHIVGTVTLLLTTSLFYLLSVVLLLRKEPETHKLPQIRWILLAALLFRVTLFPLYPAFSDDIYRYRWEGKIQDKGANPYTVAPNDARLTALRDAVYPRIDGKDFPAVYGPLIELEQRALYRVVAAFTTDARVQVFWFKGAAALADLGIIGALLVLLRRRGMRPERVLIYAWCPLPMFEFWATGHNDAIVLVPVVLALALWERRQATLWLALATAAKFWPALLFPLFTRYRWRRILASLAVLGAVAAVTAWPYRADVTSNARFATGFLGGWRNNDSLHALIAAAAGNPYTAKYITMGIIVTAALAIPLVGWRVEAGALALIVTILGFSANVHPWYLIWMVPLLALYPVPGLLLWVSLAPLAYGVLIDWTILGVWNGLSPLRWWTYGPVAVMLLAELKRLRR